MPSSERRLQGWVLVLAVAIAAATGCLTRSRAEMIEAREAYQRCVKENPATHERTCADLEAEAITRQERYEREGRQAWGCHGSTDAGCDPRERVPRTP